MSRVPGAILPGKGGPTLWEAYRRQGVEDASVKEAIACYAEAILEVCYRYGLPPTDRTGVEYAIHNRLGTNIEVWFDGEHWFSQEAAYLVAEKLWWDDESSRDMEFSEVTK
jgi:hypothetical protein